MLWWAVCLVAFVVGLVVVHVRQRLACSHNAPWAPGWLPIIGNSLQFLKHRHNFLDYVREGSACVQVVLTLYSGMGHVCVCVFDGMMMMK